MSVVTNSKNAKILILDLPHLPTKDLNSVVIHCQDIDELVVTADKYNTCILIIVCATGKLDEVASVLPNISIDALYILKNGEEKYWSLEPWWNKTTIVYNEKQLMRHLCTKSMLCFYSEGIEHRKKGDFGLANACMVDSLRVLDCSAKFI